MNVTELLNEVESLNEYQKTLLLVSFIGHAQDSLAEDKKIFPEVILNYFEEVKGDKK